MPECQASKRFTTGSLSRVPYAVKMATMRDVAELAGVSIATVSFVVNGTKRVAPATEQRISAAMAELGYRRNVVARGLASGRTRVIALLYPAFEHQLGRTALAMVTSAAEAAARRGYSLVLWPTGDDAEQVSELISGGLVDGALLMEVQLDDPRVHRLSVAGLPFALIGRTREPGAYPYVDIDFETTVHDAVDYLEGLGHSRIALIHRGRRPASGAIDERGGHGPVVRVSDAYGRAMRARGLPSEVFECAASPLAGREAAQEMMRRAPATTAVLVLNEEAASGVASGLRRAGVDVPRDVSVLSLSSSREVGALSDPILSTMSAPSSEMGSRGADALIDLLEGVTEGLPHLLLPCVLEPGESTGPAPSGPH
jgi:DNA-binding LacI/PurR family transcriptional regulator